MNDEQRDLGFPATAAVARRTDPETSHDAARSLGDLRASQLRVLQLFRLYGPMSDRALVKAAKAESIHMSDSGLRSRRAELVKAGRVEDSGKREPLDPSRGSNGVQPIIWRMVEHE